MKPYLRLAITFCFSSLSLFAQDPLRFEREVKEMTAHDKTISQKKLILFTGSSSIRLWKTMESDLSDYNVLNRGFGGSEMSDLIYYFDKLILPYKAKEIFIYEGDNDLASGKSPDQILKSADSLLMLIRTKYSKKVRVVFITPKPSVARWKLRDNYITYNQGLKSWARKKRRVAVADVWTPLLDPQGVVLKDIFMEDKLHLNAKGYSIWTLAIRKHIR